MGGRRTSRSRRACSRRATTDTRQRKHAPRSEREQRAAWWREAAAVLGGDDAVVAMLARSLARAGRPDCRTRSTRSGWRAPRPTSSDAAARAREHLAQPARPRGDRAPRPLRPTSRSRISTAWSRRRWRARCRRSCRCGSGDDDGIDEPAALAAGGRVERVRGRRVAAVHLDRGARGRGPHPRLPQRGSTARPSPSRPSSWRCCEAQANGIPVNDGQAALVRDRSRRPAGGYSSRWRLLGPGRRPRSACSPHAWADGGGTVVGLAPTGRAADELRRSLGTRTDTIAKLLVSLDADTRPPWVDAIDDADAADRRRGRRGEHHGPRSGHRLRPRPRRERAADRRHPAAVATSRPAACCATSPRASAPRSLETLVRFADPAEARASLALRVGDADRAGLLPRSRPRPRRRPRLDGRAGLRGLARRPSGRPRRVAAGAHQPTSSAS